MQEVRLDALVREIATGAMALPEFQRDFVWDPNQVIDLLDSVSHGWPIGSLLLLEGPQPFQTRAIEGAPEVDPDGVRHFLLDGQQRATALYHALTNTGDVVYFIDINDPVDEDGLPPIRWVRKKAFTENDGRFSLSSLWNDVDFAHILGELSSETALELERIREGRLGALIPDRYTLTAIIMDDNIELEALTRIFETLNRTGIRLDAFDLMVAVLYTPTFNLRDEWRSAKDLNPRFELMGVGGVEILKLIALWARNEYRLQGNLQLRGVSGIRQKDVLNIPGEYVRERWPAAVTAYAAGLEFLADRIGVVSGQANPSSAMLLTLAFLRDRGEDDRELERWFWRAVVTQAYGQGANTQVLKDVDRFGGYGFMDDATIRAQLETGLLDDARRNRILRLGLQALLVRLHGLDPVTGQYLESGDVTLIPAQGPPFDADAPYRYIKEPLVVDLMACSSRTANDLRRASRRASEYPPFDATALASQGFPAEIASKNSDEWRSQRVISLTQMMAVVW